MTEAESQFTKKVIIGKSLMLWDGGDCALGMDTVPGSSQGPTSKGPQATTVRLNIAGDPLR